MKKNLCHFYYYVPKSHLTITKQAIFAAGAGKIGKYNYCAWETKGVGQFKPESGSNAYVGKVGKITKISEYKVEILCPLAKIKQIVAALKKVHPYEEVAFGILELTVL